MWRKIFNNKKKILFLLLLKFISNGKFLNNFCSFLEFSSFFFFSIVRLYFSIYPCQKKSCLMCLALRTTKSRKINFQFDLFNGLYYNCFLIANTHTHTITKKLFHNIYRKMFTKTIVWEQILKFFFFFHYFICLNFILFV